MSIVRRTPSLLAPAPDELAAIATASRRMSSRAAASLAAFDPLFSTARAAAVSDKGPGAGGRGTHAKWRARRPCGRTQAPPLPLVRLQRWLARHRLAAGLALRTRRFERSHALLQARACRQMGYVLAIANAHAVLAGDVKPADETQRLRGGARHITRVARAMSSLSHPAACWRSEVGHGRRVHHTTRGCAWSVPSARRRYTCRSALR
jgi:hypothetical protein